MASVKDKANETNFEFGKKLAHLEEITASLEADGAELDKGLAQFDEGMKLVAELRQYLNEAAGRVEQIKQRYEPLATDVGDAPDVDVTLPF